MLSIASHRRPFACDARQRRRVGFVDERTNEAPIAAQILQLLKHVEWTDIACFRDPYPAWEQRFFRA
jgi:hypothetical protein